MIIMADMAKASKLDLINNNIKSDEMYDVYAMSLFRGNLSYLIFNIYDKRWWVEDRVVKVISNVLPIWWYFGKWTNSNGSEGAYWGFKELIFDTEFYSKLMDTMDKEAFDVLRRERTLRTEKIDQYDVVKLLGDLPEYNLTLGTLGIVEEKPNVSRNEYTISFFNHDGSKRNPIILPRVYIALDMKID